jgi:hypothetical protein
MGGMELPSWLIQGALFGVVGFCLRVIFGLITKNEDKSDEADRRIEDEIKALRRESKEVEERYRQNDRSLYEICGNLQSKFAKLEAKIECIQKG